MDTASSSQPTAARLQRHHGLLVQRYLLRNYIAHSIEGGLYMGGFRFIAAETIGPAMVATLGGPVWLVAVMPVLSMFGYIFPQILMAHYIQGMRRHMPYVVLIGVFQRLPLLAAGLVLLLAGNHHAAGLTAVAMAPLLSGLIAGFGVNAWQELVAKTVPPARRSSLFAVRNILAAGIGLAAGGVVTAVLRNHPGPVGFGLLHLVTFALLAVSFVVFLFVRETPYPVPPVRHADTFADSLRHMPRLVRADRHFATYLLADACMAGIYIMIPFLGIHALAVLNKPDEYLGFLLIVHTIGSIAGNLVGGAAGDRCGGKVTLVLSQLGFLAICLWGSLAGRSFEFLALFFLLGAAQTWLSIGKQTVGLEISPQEHRPSYLAILGCINVPATLVASLLSYVTWRATNSFACVAALTAGCVLVSATLLWRVADPRHSAR